MPILPHGPYVGLGLWRSIPATLAVELTMFAAGLWLYLAGGGNGRRRVSFWLLIGLLVVAYFGAAFGPPPPDVRTLAVSALAIWVLVPWLWWADRAQGSGLRDQGGRRTEGEQQVAGSGERSGCEESSTSTWTRSTRRSSSATTRRCAGFRSPSAGVPEHRGRRRGRQLRGARVRRALGDPDVARRAALPVARDRASRLREVQGRVADRLRDLPLRHAAGRAAVARRGLPRRDRERVGRAAGPIGRAAPEGRRSARPPA